MIPSHFKTPDKFSSEKAAKKSKVHLFLSMNGIDVLENKTKVCDRSTQSFQGFVQTCVLEHQVTRPPRLCRPQFLLYSCPLSTVSFCAVLPSSPKVFGFVTQHPAAETHYCYLFQNKKFVSVFTATNSAQNHTRKLNKENNDRTLPQTEVQVSEPQM